MCCYFLKIINKLYHFLKLLIFSQFFFIKYLNNNYLNFNIFINNIIKIYVLKLL